MIFAEQVIWIRRREILAAFWYQNLKKKKNHLGDLGLDGKIALVYNVSYRNIVKGCGMYLCGSGSSPVWVNTPGSSSRRVPYYRNTRQIFYKGLFAFRYSQYIPTDSNQDLYFSPNIIRVIKLRTRWARHVACMGERRGAYGALVGRPGGQRPLGRPMSRWGK